MEKLIPWSERIKGARDMLLALRGRFYLNESESPRLDRAGRIMNAAVINLLLQDKTNIDRFLKEEPIEFYDWDKDKNGKPIKCKARFK